MAKTELSLSLTHAHTPVTIISRTTAIIFRTTHATDSSSDNIYNYRDNIIFKIFRITHTADGSSDNIYRTNNI
jgi:hypothetical protein